MPTSFKPRCSLRLKGFDYASTGGYFVTIVAHQRAHLFGTVQDARMDLSPAGNEVWEAWNSLVERFTVALDDAVVMPNHFHGVMHLPGDDATLSQVIGAFKSLSTKAINRCRNTQGARVWQTGFYDHILRDENDLARIRAYIRDNPARWSADRYFTC